MYSKHRIHEVTLRKNPKIVLLMPYLSVLILFYQSTHSALKKLIWIHSNTPNKAAQKLGGIIKIL